MNLPNHHSLSSANLKVPGSKLGDNEGKESEIAAQKSVVFIANFGMGAIFCHTVSQVCLSLSSCWVYPCL